MGEVRFRLNDELHELLKRYARENGMDMTEAVEEALSAHLFPHLSRGRW
jgi:predicted HicB family RNase H-like nuclease